VIADRAAATRFPPGHAAEDGRLVLAARAGDEAAFARLYERYGRIVHALLLARVAREEIDDLVQDVFLTAWRRLDDLRDPAAFGGWICMIARNRAIDAHRHAPSSSSCREPARPRRRGADRKRTDARVALDAIRSLPEAYRDTLMLRLVEGNDRAGNRRTHRADARRPSGSTCIAA
jgi:RNA polymerase sigma-70 factor (ECF subfamily)